MTFEANVRCEIFARVWVEAQNEQEARRKLHNGGGYWAQAEFETHTADAVEVENLKNLDAEDPEEPEEEEDED